MRVAKSAVDPAETRAREPAISAVHSSRRFSLWFGSTLDELGFTPRTCAGMCRARNPYESRRARVPSSRACGGIRRSRWGCLARAVTWRVRVAPNATPDERFGSAQPSMDSNRVSTRMNAFGCAAQSWGREFEDSRSLARSRGLTWLSTGQQLDELRKINASVAPPALAGHWRLRLTIRLCNHLVRCKPTP